MKSPKKRASPLFTSKGIERAQSKLPPPPSLHISHSGGSWSWTAACCRSWRKQTGLCRLRQPGPLEWWKASETAFQSYRNIDPGPNDLLPRRRRRPRIFERRGRCPQRCSFLKLIVTRLLDVCSSRGSVDPKAGRSSRNDCSARTCVKFTTTQRSQVSLGPELSASRRRGAKGSKGKGKSKGKEGNGPNKGKGKGKVWTSALPKDFC